MCGNPLNGMETFCSKCGHRLHSDQAYPNSSTTTNNSLVLIGVIVLAFIGLFTFSNYNEPYPSSFISNIGALTQSEIQGIKDVDEMRKAIDNTIWTNTEVGDLFWSKLEFKNNKVRFYYAMPSDGKWTFEEECSYTLEEGRFIDDGRRYIAAVINSKDMNISPKFIITNGHLTWLGIIDAGGFVLGDYEWD